MQGFDLKHQLFLSTHRCCSNRSILSADCLLLHFIKVLFNYKHVTYESNTCGWLSINIYFYDEFSFTVSNLALTAFCFLLFFSEEIILNLTPSIFANLCQINWLQWKVVPQPSALLEAIQMCFMIWKTIVLFVQSFHVEVILNSLGAFPMAYHRSQFMFFNLYWCVRKDDKRRWCASSESANHNCYISPPTCISTTQYHGHSPSIYPSIKNNFTLFAHISLTFTQNIIFCTDSNITLHRFCGSYI